MRNFVVLIDWYTYDKTGIRDGNVSEYDPDRNPTSHTRDILLVKAEDREDARIKALGQYHDHNSSRVIILEAEPPSGDIQYITTETRDYWKYAYWAMISTKSVAKHFGVTRRRIQAKVKHLKDSGVKVGINIDGLNANLFHRHELGKLAPLPEGRPKSSD